MNLEIFVKHNKGKKYLNYTIDKKFAILFDDKQIILFKKKGKEFKKKNYFKDFNLIEIDKFRKWNIVNQKILKEKSSTNLLYLTSEIIL